MGNETEMSEAEQRLDAALTAMEDAVAGKRRKGLTVESLEEQLQSLEENLAAERARGQKLTAANDGATERIDAIIGTIKNMLSKN